MENKPAASNHEKAIEALMALLAERDWGDIGLPDIAARAGLTLADLRGAFPSKGAILAAFSRQIDQKVLKLDAASSELIDQPARERLFDVVLRRFDALQPYKEAIRSARRGLLADPLSLSAWNRVEVTSAQWMLAAAGIEKSGPEAAMKAQGLAVLFARVLGTWLDEDEPDMPRTMRELDRQLRQAERLLETADVVKTAARPFLSIAERLLARRPRSRASDSEDAIDPQI
ncbi:TetR/AcrR family transcriptional regulator [Terrihabitans sp. B22-R8]|uniref:TetR/AcrR family transcriptional regulator n=1 Tax=Terrihabitans sp. B22-R8 TaxID=3425128 RepID=UPI00403D2648